jgi:hypothetical protein
MRGRDLRTRVLTLLVFLTPLVLVKATELVVAEAGPKKARATDPNDDPEDITIEPFVPSWSTEQRVASAHVVELALLDYGPSPLLHRKRPRVVPNGTDNPPRVEDAIVPPPNVTVQMILKSRSGNVALIDRKRYRTGDALGDDGWVVEEIEDRSINIFHPRTKQKATLVVPLPR